MAKTPQAYLVQAIRRIWRYSPERRECLKNAEKCYVCEDEFKTPPKIKVRKSKFQDGAYEVIFSDKKDDFLVSLSKKEANAERKAVMKAWNKLNAPQADHIKPIGSAPTTWDGWDLYLKKMFGNKLAAICKSCHKKKTHDETLKRNAAKKKLTLGMIQSAVKKVKKIEVTGADLDGWVSRLPGSDK